MGNYVQSNLSSNESVICETKLHWINFAWSIVFVLFTGASAKDLPVLFGISIIVAISVLITFITSEFAVTSKRVMIKVGLISRKTFELNLAKIESVNVSQNILGRLLNYGTITVIGTGGSREIFYKINKPIEFRKNIMIAHEKI